METSENKVSYLECVITREGIRSFIKYYNQKQMESELYIFEQLKRLHPKIVAGEKAYQFFIEALIVVSVFAGVMMINSSQTYIHSLMCLLSALAGLLATLLNYRHVMYKHLVQEEKKSTLYQTLFGYILNSESDEIIACFKERDFYVFDKVHDTRKEFIDTEDFFTIVSFTDPGVVELHSEKNKENQIVQYSELQKYYKVKYLTSLEYFFTLDNTEPSEYFE